MSVEENSKIMKEKLMSNGLEHLPNKISNPSLAEGFYSIFGSDSPESSPKKDTGSFFVSIDKLFPFGFNDLNRKKLHIFKPYSEEHLSELADDIKINGVLTPLLVRKIDNRHYEILAGHNRYNAAKLAGLESLPCRVMEADDNQAVIIMTTTNLNQRDNLSPMELAYAYKYQLEAISSSQLTNSNIGEALVDVIKKPKASIYRYIRLTNLAQCWQSKIDDNELPLTTGANISYLNIPSQELLFDYHIANKTNISLAISENLKKAFGNGEKLTSSHLDNFFSKKKNSKQPTRKSQPQLSISPEKYNKYFAGKKPKEIQELIEQLLDAHFKEDNAEAI